jgi:hypothetical protein
MAGQQNAADLPILMDDRQVDGLFQKGLGDLHFESGKQPGFRPLPARQQLTTCVQHLGIGHFFGGRNQRQRLGGGGFVVEHHGGFHGVIDRACDQVQVVVGVDAQGQYAQQGQGDTGHRHAHQRDNQMAAAEDRAQGRAAARFE